MLGVTNSPLRDSYAIKNVPESQSGLNQEALDEWLAYRAEDLKKRDDAKSDKNGKEKAHAMVARRANANG